MAGQSSISVDPGTTTKLGTFQRSDGTNTIEVYKQVLDEPFAATYIVVATGIALATANSHLLQIMAGASLKVIVRRISVYQAANATTSQQVQMRLFRLTSAGTGGGAITPALYDPADAASGAAAMTLPSSKGTESTQVSQRRGFISTAVASVAINPVFEYDFSDLRHKGLVIAAGTSNGIALKNVSSDAAGTVDIEAEFSELPYSV